MVLLIKTTAEISHSLAEEARRWREARTLWAISRPCIHELLATVTHPRIWDPPTPTEAALEEVEPGLEWPSLVLPAEGPEHWGQPRTPIEAGRIAGPRVHDAWATRPRARRRALSFSILERLLCRPRSEGGGTVR